VYGSAGSAHDGHPHGRQQEVVEFPFYSRVVVIAGGTHEELDRDLSGRVGCEIPEHERRVLKHEGIAPTASGNTNTGNEASALNVEG
jgi:hypothetical protein